MICAIELVGWSWGRFDERGLGFTRRIGVVAMSCQLQSEVEGSLSEFVHFPSASTVVELQGYHGRMGAVPPLSSASRAHTPRPPFLHDGRSRPHYMHGGEFEMPDYDYVARRHSYGDHLRLDSGTLLERLLLQEQQKALQMASLVHSQTSGCLSGCHSYWLSQKRLNYKDSDDRLAEDRRRCSRNFGELLSRSVNPGAKADTMEFADGRFRQPRPVESIGGVGERSETRNSFAEAELERLICQVLGRCPHLPSRKNHSVDRGNKLTSVANSILILLLNVVGIVAVFLFSNIFLTSPFLLQCTATCFAANPVV